MLNSLFCGVFAFRTALDIGNGNIASVRLGALFARIGTRMSEKLQEHSKQYASIEINELRPGPYCIQCAEIMGSSRCEVARSRYRIPGVAEVAVTIIFRVIVGVVCDVLGARRGLAFLLFLACPGIVGMMSARCPARVDGWVARQSWTCSNAYSDRTAERGGFWDTPMH